MATPGAWDFIVCDGGGTALTTLTRNQGTSLTFTRNGVPECTFSLSHDDDECATILDALANGTGGGVPTLRGYRVGTDGVRSLRFNGYLAGVSDESGVDSSTGTFTFRGPFGRLLGDGSNRGRFLVSFLSPPADLAAVLLDGSGFLPAGAYTYTVTAINGAGETIGSTPVTKVSAGSGRIDLTWTAIGGATGYKVYRSTTAGPPNGAGNGYRTLGAVTSMTDDGAGVAFTAGAAPTVNTAASPAVSYSATDAGAIAKALIDGANAYSPTGVGTTGTITPTKTRDRTYPSHSNIGEAVVNLTAVLDGLDFEVSPVDDGSTLGIFTVYAQQGSDQPNSKFEYGPTTLANCLAMHRQTLPPVNHVTVIGANGLSSTKQDDTSIARYGHYEYVMTQTDVSEQATLDDKANALLRPNPVKVIDFTPEPRLAPSPWDDYWIGDTVQFYAKRGALKEGPVSVRVNQITVVIEPDTGLESATIPDPVSADEERVIRASIQTEVAEGAIV